MDAKEFMPLLEAFIAKQNEIAGNWDGDMPQSEDEAMIAKERAKAAEKLKAVITEYDL
jgi:hypothetical protein